MMVYTSPGIQIRIVLIQGLLNRCSIWQV